jgi:competence ComEA-like helix-hairpin-helix protein
MTIRSIPLLSVLLPLGLLCATVHPSVAHGFVGPPLIAAAKQALDGKLNVQTATEQEWILLPGVGPATAAKIIAYRERYGFRQLSQLMRVKGIGRKTFAAMRPYLSLEGPTTLRRVPAPP